MKSGNWSCSREDMDSFTVNPESETGEFEHVVYVYPPNDEPRIPIFGPNNREYAKAIVEAMNARTEFEGRAK